jgi:hypothetical protein
MFARVVLSRRREALKYFCSSGFSGAELQAATSSNGSSTDHLGTIIEARGRTISGILLPPTLESGPGDAE